MKRVKISLEDLPDDLLKEAVKVIKRGGVIVYPTDTVY
ncbi:MAG: threonylcarbamoyl-AMP synthase, partial [Candidatus Methanomethylicota archaeon]